ncbi:molybdenum cofactor biosynthesis prote [Stemphylium lycopersici]|nr:molybdenum cofactor biosynthesis prote [Stemphylium lycopersici]
MVHMARIRAGPAALRRAAGRGELFSRSPICAIRTRSIATNAAIREPASIPPVSIPQRSSAEERRAAIKKAKPFSDFLTDTFNRQHDYLRISITERCNLRCLYCMPEEGVPLSPSANMLTTPEIFYLSSLFVSQGVTKIRLTGGEPTVRRDIVPLMQQIGSLRPKGLRELALTTNGISLHRKLDAMVEAGLTGVNLSLDTLDPFQFQIMTRRKGFDAVMKSIDRILEINKLGANVKLKVNCVVMRGLNEREILPFVEMGREKDIEVRFIEYMPFGGNKWSENKMISFQEMLDNIKTKYPGLRPVAGHKNDTSKTYEVPGFVGKVGFITSMTNDFCGSCNRLRITSDGNLKVCLHGNAEVSLRDVLRQGNNGEPIDQEAFECIRQVEMDRHEGRLSDETILGWGKRERELLDVVGAAVKRKAEKHADLDDLANMENRPMILIDDQLSKNRALPPSFPFLQTHPTGLKGSYAPPARMGMRYATVSHLYPTVLPSNNGIRAFSTSHACAYRGGHLKAFADPEKTVAEKLEYAWGAEGVRRLRRVVADGPWKVRLPEPLAEVRQKYGLTAPRYNTYWRRVAEAKLLSGKGQVFKQANKVAHSKFLSVYHGSDGLKHKDLMREVQSIIDQERRDREMFSLDDVLEAERREAEKLEAKRLEAVRLEEENHKAERLEQENLEAERLEKEKLEEVKQQEASEIEVPKPRQSQQSKIATNNLRTFLAEVQTPLHRDQRLEEVRKRKEEILEKKRALLKDLEEQEQEEKRAKRVVRSDVPQPHHLDKVLNHALSMVDRSFNEREPTRARHEPDQVLRVKKVTESDTFYQWPKGAGSIHVLGEQGDQEAPTESLPKDALSGLFGDEPQSRSAPVRDIANNRLQPQDFSQATRSKDAVVNTPSPQKPSDKLRLAVPPSGITPIDEDLVVDFGSSIPKLQAHVYEMVQRLKGSYPRFDALPYEIWKSENRKTLQTWLRVLVTRWKTRFEDVDKTGQLEKKVVNKQMQDLLDYMVREQNLDNEAAERMALRWHEILGQRGSMDGEAGGVLDWDEFHAGGMGFLANEPEYEAPPAPPQQQQRNYSGASPVPANNKRPSVHGDTHEPVTRKMYSTSSRPPLDPELVQQVQPGKDAKATPSSTHPPASLPHLTSSGSAHMVSVSEKAHTVRSAIAVGSVYFTNPTPLSLIRSNSLKKGDALGVSRIAGIMAAKKCPELIPLCHPIPLTHVSVELQPFSAAAEESSRQSVQRNDSDLGHGGVHIEAKVQCTGPTGVEMEALTAVMGAALSVVDMCKAVDKFQRVQDVRVVLKEGGKMLQVPFWSMLSSTSVGRDDLGKPFLCDQRPAAVSASFLFLASPNATAQHSDLIMATAPAQNRFKPGFCNAPTFHVFARKNWLNILTQLLCLTASILLYTLCPPILPRYFPNFDGVEMSAAGSKYAQPVRPEIIGTYPMAVLSYAIPAIVMGGLGLWVIRDFWDTNAALMGLGYALTVSTLFVDFIKIFIGGLRPNFYQVCKPIHFQIPAGAHMSGPYYDTADQVCASTDESKLKEAQMSFPSGHACGAFAGFVFLALWLNAHFKTLGRSRSSTLPRRAVDSSLESPPNAFNPISDQHHGPVAHWKLILFAAPWCIASLLSLSKVSDGWHHPIDVVCGAILGTFFAFMAYRMVYWSIWDARDNHVPR